MRNILLLVICALLLSCNSTTKPAEPEAFSLKITLTDTAGNPLEGYKAAVFQKDYSYFLGINPQHYRPSTTVSFTLAAPHSVDIIVQDYFGKLVQSLLLSEPYVPGSHHINWNGKDNAGNTVRDGIYKIVAKYYDGETLVYTGTSLAYKLGEFKNIAIYPYETDANGEISSSDITPFPVLYCTETFKHLGAQQEDLGDLRFSETSDTMEVAIEHNGVTKHQYFKMKNRANVLSLNWDTMATVTKTHFLAGAPSSETNKTSQTLTEKPLTIKESGATRYLDELKNNYPNPFN
ncbi:MAG: FlgD immunoglobulin-like domain containing protein [Candidatus Cloacimonetes bacterium]|nr:FlgD immunoglobulin-like domain containing protein [Candidatus Cloacimonadota bacterium]